MDGKRDKIAIIIGAGPAGLTAAYELLQKTEDIKPLIFEEADCLGGISRTVNYKGNLMDMGGHRFFSKSDRVMGWWRNIMPIEETCGPDPRKTDKVMLLRQRLSRIFFLRKFFDYPISLNLNTILNLGPLRMLKIGLSYIKIRLFPIAKEKSLEDFFINRFGRELYATFFKDYTEKVWGRPCSEIDPAWGAQRIKGLSVSKAVLDFLKKSFVKKSVEQKNTETSLIRQFLYPKFGPGQMWQEVARLIKERGGEIFLNSKVTGLERSGSRIIGVKVNDRFQPGDYFFSTMPVKDLIESLEPPAAPEVLETAGGLIYRDFITVGLLLKKLKIKAPDTWIYIQEPDVKLGRLQVFNNWSPYLVKDKDKIWMGLEYFCTEGDTLWNKSDGDFINFAADELAHIGIIDRSDVLDGTLVRLKKTYPAYFGSYNDFQIIRKFTDSLENLFLIGRNGMHRYNNQDHSMLTAMEAVENIIKGVKTKDNIWAVNAEKDYHESK